jgi:hypothetical protein
MDFTLSDVKEIIIGIFGSIIAAIILLAIKKPKRTIKRVIVSIAVLLIIIAMFHLVWKVETIPYIKITSHNNHYNVDLTETVEGIFKRIPKGDIIWIIVYSHSDHRFYPSSTAATIVSDDRWVNYNTTIGSSADSGHHFDIIPVLLNSNAQEVVRKYISDTERHGLPDIPSGSQAFDKIVVNRR